MNTSYRIKYSPESKQDIEEFARHQQGQIKKAIEKAAENP